MKQASPSSTWLELSDPEAARMVTDPKARRYLEPFIAQERSVGQLAEELGVDMSSALYRVRQFLRLGLIERVRLEPRRGRAIKVYRAVAEGFYVPFSLTPHATTESLAPATFSTLQTRLTKNIAAAWTQAAGEPRALGIHIFRRPDGLMSQNITPYPGTQEPYQFFTNLCEPEAPAVWDSWNERQLSFESAKRLQRELAEVLERYPDEASAGSVAYMVRLAMAPLSDAE